MLNRIEATKARINVRKGQRSLNEINEKLLHNLECEKAGEELPYDWQELHAEAEAMRAESSATIEAVSDEAAIYAKDLFPKLKGRGELIAAGTRINWNGTIKRAAVDLWDTAENTPDNAPALWEDINKKGEYREIPETITAGLAFAKGELGWWKGVLYKSLIDNNTWNPEQYIAGWEEVST